MGLDAHDADYAGILRAFRWWSLLRNAKADGVEWFTHTEILERFDAFGLSRRQLYDLIDSTDSAGSIFFTLSGGRVWLRSLESVCTQLGVVPGTPFAVPAAAVAGHLRNFKAELYATGMAFERTASRERLESEYGVTANTQRAYEAQSGVAVTPNFVRASLLDFEELPIPDGAHVWTVRDENGTPCVIWQVPNTYHLKDADRQRPGQAKHIRKQQSQRPFARDEVQQRQRFLVEKLHGRLRGPVALKTNETFDIVRASGRHDKGAIYEYVIL